MECLTEARALKRSQRGETTAVKLGKAVVSEELCLNHVSAADDFPVECFLDFSDDDDGLEDALVHGGEGDDEEDEEGQEIVSVSSSQEQAEDDNGCGFGYGFGPLCSDPSPADQLPLPVDDISELEWVSRFVDDCSLPELSLLFPAREAKPGKQTCPRSEPESYRLAPRKKPRSKRAGNGKTNWPSISLTGSTALRSTADVFSGGSQNLRKKPRKKWQEGKRGESQEGRAFQRRCSHCGAHNTPQWRTGPLGAKTLCNACGVRYKSGRLCPEYRPVGSPTFSSVIHSNNHRKVLELRQRKELGEAGPLHHTTG